MQLKVPISLLLSKDSWLLLEQFFFWFRSPTNDNRNPATATTAYKQEMMRIRISIRLLRRREWTNIEILIAFRFYIQRFWLVAACNYFTKAFCLIIPPTWLTVSVKNLDNSSVVLAPKNPETVGACTCTIKVCISSLVFLWTLYFFNYITQLW